MEQKVDTLNRDLFTERTQHLNTKFEPDDIQLDMMLFVARVGMASSDTLYELVRHRKGVRNRRNFYDRLRAIFDGGMFYRPEAQTYTNNPYNNYHLFRLTKRGIRYLGALYEECEPLSGMFPHQAFQATVRGAFDIGCMRDGYTLLPTQKWVPKKLTHVPFKWNGTTVNTKKDTAFDPDDVIAIDYGDKSVIQFMVEENRSTETLRANALNRRSDRKTIRQLKQFIGKKQYVSDYGRDPMMMYLYVTVNETHKDHFLSLVEEEMGKSPHIGAAVVPEFQRPWKPPRTPMYLYEGRFERVGYEPFSVGNPPR